MADSQALHLQMFDTIRARDLDGLRALLHPDYSYMGGDGVEQVGADTAIAIAGTYLTACSDLSFEIRHQHSAGDVSIAEFVARGTHDGPLGDIPASGNSIEAFVCNVIEVRDGKIYREREYFDPMPMLKQIGVVA